MEQEKQQGIKVNCKKCDRVWVYRGNNPYYANCSRCRNAININKNKVTEEVTFS